MNSNQAKQIDPKMLHARIVAGLYNEGRLFGRISDKDVWGVLWFHPALSGRIFPGGYSYRKLSQSQMNEIILIANVVCAVTGAVCPFVPKP